MGVLREHAAGVTAGKLCRKPRISLAPAYWITSPRKCRYLKSPITSPRTTRARHGQNARADLRQLALPPEHAVKFYCGNGVIVQRIYLSKLRRCKSKVIHKSDSLSERPYIVIQMLGWKLQLDANAFRQHVLRARQHFAFETLSVNFQKNHIIFDQIQGYQAFRL